MTLHARALATRLAAASLAVLPLAAAHAEPKPVIVLVHLAAATQADWMTLAGNLANDGFMTISVNLPAGESATQGSDRILKTLAANGTDRFLLVATDDTAPAVDSLAAAEPQKVKALVTISAIATPASSLALPQYFIHLTQDKKFNSKLSAETSFNVPTDKAVANTDDLVKVLENLSTRKPAQEAAAIAHQGPVVASLK